MKYLDKDGLTYLSNKLKGWVNSSQHPVNSLYLTMGTEDPAKLFGGTWKKITSGMLYASESNAGATGGSATQTLSVANLPSHSHGFSGTTAGNNRGHTHGYTKATGVQYHAITANELANHYHNVVLKDKPSEIMRVHYGAGTWGTFGEAQRNSNVPTSAVITDGYGGNASHNHGLSTSSVATGDESQNHTHTFSGTTGSTGNGSAFSIMPPHVNVYVWQRTA